MSQIYKHIFTITVLSEDKEFDNVCLEDLAREIDQGNSIGQVEHKSVDEVPADRVKDELEAIGNDGSFFESLSDAEDEESDASDDSD